MNKESVIQTVKDHTCLPQAGASDIRPNLKLKGKDPAEKAMRNTSRVHSLF
jgi:hypothetical protein